MVPGRALDLYHDPRVRLNPDPDPTLHLSCSDRLCRRQQHVWAYASQMCCWVKADRPWCQLQVKLPQGQEEA